MLKKGLKITGIIILVLLVLAFTLPLLFKGKILNIAKTEINKNLNATIDFKDIDISLFRHFPRLAVGLQQLQVVGKDDFANDTLIAAKKIDIALNLMSLFGGKEMSIYAVNIDEPRIHAIVNKDGKANWDITQPSEDTAAATTTSFKMKLNHYAINNGYISYKDIPGVMNATIEGLDHSGSGDFTADLFTLSTKTSANAVNFNYSNIPYLINAKTSLGADIEVDTKNNKYSFKTDDIALNDLKLSTEGFFSFVNDTTYGMDIKFNAPSTEFKTILSLIPAVYKNDFDKIKTSGKAIFNGFVKGEYNSVKIPAYNINLDVQDGFFQYPDLPQPVKNIAVSLKVDNPDGITDHTVVDISKGHIEFGNDPFDFKLLLKNPVTDQYIDATLKGKLNLNQVTQFVKLSGNTKLTGILDADATAKGNVSAITQQKAGPFSANGFINITNLNYSSSDFPQPIRNSNIQINFQNPDGVADHTLINIPTAHVEIGDNPIDFSVAIKNPATTLYFDGKAKGKFNLASAQQFSQLEPGTNLAGLLDANISFNGNKAAIDKKAYDQVKLAGTLNLSKLNYSSKDYPDGIKVPQADFTFNPKNITLNSLKAEYLKSTFTANGSVDNAIGYALKNEAIGGTLNVHADQINLNDFMGTAPADTAAVTPSSNATPFAVPANVAFTVNAAVDKLTYDKTDYNNLKGTIAIRDETASLRNVQMDALDGKIILNGSYSTKNNKKTPDLAFNYDVSNLSAEKTFYAFNTVQKLMPIGKFISGKISSKLTVAGKLGSDMSPLLNSLTGSGNLLLIEGVLQKFTPVEKLAQSLNVSELNGFSLKDIKTYFDFANGKVLVKPFKIKVKDIEMEVGGMHGLDQSIDYAIGLKLPRSLIGNQGNALINNLAQQASNNGVPVKLSDVINLNVKMGGTISNPQLKTDLKESAGDLAADLKQQAADFAKQQIDSAKQQIKDTVNALKNQALQEIKEDLTKQLLGGKDSSGSVGKPLENTKKNAEEAVKNTLNNLLKKKTTKDTTKKD